MLNADFQDLTTIQKLELWGMWVRTSSLRALSYQLPVLGHRSGQMPVITDEQGLYVDRGVVKLKARDRMYGGMIIRYYAGKFRVVELAEMWGCSRVMASAYLKGAEAWLDGYFCFNELAAA